MFWIPVLGWMSVIFYFSSQNGEESGGLSAHVLESILNFFNIYDANIELLGFLLRKAAHASVYFVLAVFVILALVKNSRLNGLKVYACTLLICFIYACSDELHQFFVPGRSMMFTDVMIDICGVLAALLLFYAGGKIYDGIKNSKKQGIFSKMLRKHKKGRA